MAGGMSTADDCLYYWKAFEEKKPFVLRAEQREKKLEGDTPHTDIRPDAALIARGAYLAAASDCVSCHTVPGKLPCAGSTG
jgi:mono/diheme cytochrome c family protein